MKVLCSAQVSISAPIEQVFNVVAGIDKWPLWFGCIVSAQRMQSEPLALDQEVHLCLQAGRKRWHETFEVSHYVRNAFLSFEGSFSASRRIDFRLEQRAKHVRVACAIGYPVFGGVFPTLLDATFVRPRILRELRASLKHLRAQVEEAAMHPVFAADALSDSQTAPTLAGSAAPDGAPRASTQESDRAQDWAQEANQSQAGVPGSLGEVEHDREPASTIA